MTEINKNTLIELMAMRKYLLFAFETLTKNCEDFHTSIDKAYSKTLESLAQLLDRTNIQLLRCDLSEIENLDGPINKLYEEMVAQHEWK